MSSPPSPAAQQIVVAVVGMHRSGTSLTAEAIRGFDVATGPKLIVADDHNQHGYGEDAVVVQAHNTLLHGLDRGWNTLRGTFPLPADWTQRVGFEATRSELANYLTGEFRRVGGRVWAVKDPRMSILLPLWFRLERDLGFKLVIVFCVRNAGAVANSLEKRDGIPGDLGRLIWLEYNAAIVTHAAPRIQAILDYDTWFSNPEGNLNLLQNAIGQPLGAGRDQVLRLVNSELRHHAGDTQDGVFATWQSLLKQWAQTQQVPAGLPGEARRVTDFLDAFAPWRKAVTEQSYLMSMIDAREKEIRALVEVADRHLEAFRTADGLFKEARQAIGRLERERDELVAVADRHLQAYRTKAADMEQLTEQMEQLTKRFELVMSRFDRFPMSWLVPEAARETTERAAD
jgi:hypothetical protein